MVDPGAAPAGLFGADLVNSPRFAVPRLIEGSRQADSMKGVPADRDQEVLSLGDKARAPGDGIESFFQQLADGPQQPGEALLLGSLLSWEEAAEIGELLT